MKKIIAVVIILAVIYGATELPGYFSRERVLVERVIDGDTIETSLGTIRLLGINTPEENEPYYKEAKQELKHLIEGKYVDLEKDSRDKDAYKRYLRYVFLNEKFINLIIIENGLAEKFGYNLKYEKDILEAEDLAKKNNLGIWSLD